MPRAKYSSLFGVSVTESCFENDLIVIPTLNFREEINDHQEYVITLCYRVFGFKRCFDIDFSRGSIILVELFDIPKIEVEKKINFFISLLEEEMEA